MLKNVSYRVNVLQNEVRCIVEFIDYVPKQRDKQAMFHQLIIDFVEKFAPTHGDELWDNARTIYPYSVEAQNLGLLDNETDVQEILSWGYRKVYIDSIRDNFEYIIYNMIIDGVNSYLASIPEKQANHLTGDIDFLYDEIEGISTRIDDEYTYHELNNEIIALTERIVSEEFVS